VIQGGLKFKAVVNGRRALNGALYSSTITGDSMIMVEGLTIYDVLAEVAAHLAEQNADMEFPEALQVTIVPKQNEVRS
jgi:cystathionine beta-lyase family protein involved in aluminum resistance